MSASIGGTSGAFNRYGLSCMHAVKARLALDLRLDGIKASLMSRVLYYIVQGYVKTSSPNSPINSMQNASHNLEQSQGWRIKKIQRQLRLGPKWVDFLSYLP